MTEDQQQSTKIACFTMNNDPELFGKLGSILSYKKCNPMPRFWKCLVTEEQTNEAYDILKDKDIFLNLDTLSVVDDGYFLPVETVELFDLAYKGLTIYDKYLPSDPEYVEGEDNYKYIILKDREVVEI